MVLILLFSVMLLSSCATQEAYVKAPVEPQKYYTHQNFATSRAYITSTNNKRYTPSSISSVRSGVFAWPVQGRLVGAYGQNLGGAINKGINISISGNPQVCAANDGQVVFANYVKGWGQTMIVAHSGNMYTVYANLKNITIREGIRVRKGDPIAQLAAGSGQDSVLHFEVRKDHLPQNPLRYLN